MEIKSYFYLCFSRIYSSIFFLINKQCSNFSFTYIYTYLCIYSYLIRHRIDEYLYKFISIVNIISFQSVCFCVIISYCFFRFLYLKYIRWKNYITTRRELRFAPYPVFQMNFSPASQESPV